MRTSSISVVIPNYNHGHHIENQLNALLSQSVRPLEVIVIDDASRDDSVAVVEPYTRKDPIVQLIRNERNLGVIATVNRGLKLCRGDYFIGVAADDVVAPGFLEKIVRMTDQHPEAGIYFGMYRVIDAQDRELAVKKSSRWTEETFATPETFLNEYLEVEFCTDSPSPTTVFRRRCLEEVGCFREELGFWGDTFALRAIGLKYGACYTPQMMATFRLLEGGFSATQVRNARLVIDIIARAAWLMRSPNFRDRFPESHVTRWERAFRDWVIGQHIGRLHQSIFRESDHDPPACSRLRGIGRRMIHSTKCASFRLLASYHWRRPQAYVPDLTCYLEASG